jgi:hypothetical protein
MTLTLRQCVVVLAALATDIPESKLTHRAAGEHAHTREPGTIKSGAAFGGIAAPNVFRPKSRGAIFSAGLRICYCTYDASGARFVGPNCVTMAS